MKNLLIISKFIHTWITYLCENYGIFSNSVYVCVSYYQRSTLLYLFLSIYLYFHFQTGNCEYFFLLWKGEKRIEFRITTCGRLNGLWQKILCVCECMSMWRIKDNKNISRKKCEREKRKRKRTLGIGLPCGEFFLDYFCSEIFNGNFKKNYLIFIIKWQIYFKFS